MNAPFVTRDRVAEKLAFVRAARGRWHRYLNYRRWAEEAAAAGQPEVYRRWKAEGLKQRESALVALSYARLQASYG